MPGNITGSIKYQYFLLSSSRFSNICPLSKINKMCNNNNFNIFGEFYEIMKCAKYEVYKIRQTYYFLKGMLISHINFGGKFDGNLFILSTMGNIHTFIQ